MHLPTLEICDVSLSETLLGHSMSREQIAPKFQHTLELADFVISETVHQN